MAWSNGLAHWIDGDTALISVAFSWKIAEARRLAEYYKSKAYRVRVGGTILHFPQNRKSFEGLAEMGGEADALAHHNSLATIASRGCPVGCWFCVVPLVEGKSITLIPDFVPRPILCDSNLSALPVEYQEHIIRRYQETGIPLLDANSGFEPMTFDRETYLRWKSINRGAWRFAFDEMKEEEQVRRMADIVKDEIRQRKRVYVLIGNEPIAACHERVQKVIEWDCEPHCQAILPLNALSRDSFKILHDWDVRKLKDFMRWANTWLWKSVPLKEYKPRINDQPVFASAAL